MVKIKYDVRDSDPEKAKAREGFEKPQPGVYRVKILEIEPRFAKDERTGKEDKTRPALNVKVETADKKNSGHWMWEWVPTESEAAKWKYDQFLMAIGQAGDKTKRKGEFDTDDYVGNFIRVRVRAEKGAAEYTPEIAAFLPLGDEDGDEDGDPSVDDELGGAEGDDLGGDDDAGGEDDEEVLYYDMAELASMNADGLKQVAEDLSLEVPAAKAKSRVSLSKWIFENQPGEPPDDDEEPDLEALGEAADAEDDEAQEKLIELAAEAELDPDDFDTWALLVEALAAAGGEDDKGSPEAEEPDLDALGEAADGEDEDAQNQLTEIAGEKDLDPDDFETWAELATAIAGTDGGEKSDEEDGYDELTDKQLKAELKDRGLSTAGAKAALVKRLRQDDQKDPF